MNHLGVYRRKLGNKDYIQMIFEGKKTVDIKLSYKKNPPYNVVNNGDILYIKESSGPVVGRVHISKVKNIEITDSVEILEILLSIQKEVGLDDEEHAKRMFKRIANKRYVTLFEFVEPQALNKPIYIEKSDRRVWIVNYQLSKDLKLAYS